MRATALEQRGAVLARVRPRQRSSSGCAVELGRALVEHERQRADAFGDQPHRAMHDGVLPEALARNAA